MESTCTALKSISLTLSCGRWTCSAGDCRRSDSHADRALHKALKQLGMPCSPMRSRCRPKKPIPKAKQEYRLAQFAAERESKFHDRDDSDDVVDYRVFRRNGQWMAHGGKKCAMADTPEEALAALRVKIHATSTPVDHHRAAKHLRYRANPTFDILDFAVQDCLDSLYTYRVVFATNVNIRHRGEMERIGSTAMQREVQGESAQAHGRASGDGTVEDLFE